MKRIICAVLVILMLFSVLAGCSKEISAEFYVNDTLDNTLTIQSGEAITAPHPAVTGYVFAGWYASQTDTAAYDFSAEPTKDIGLHAKFVNVLTGKETFNAVPLKEDELSAEFASYDAFGKVIAAAPIEDGAYIVAEGYALDGEFGYKKKAEGKSASMTVGVVITSKGVITKVVNIDSFAQGAGYAEKITDTYLDGAYKEVNAASTLEVEPVTGATGSSSVVMHAVQTAAYYAENVYKFVAENNDGANAELSAVYAAKYTSVKTDFAVDSKEIGTVLYAAEGTAEDGTQVVAMKIKSAKKYNYDGSSKVGWAESEPSPFTMVIVVDKATNKVIAWKVLTDGTKKKELFTVPDEKIDTYKTVAITSATAFDSFKDGLVFDLDVEKSIDESEGLPIITGTSIVYTGTTVDGSFSSQLIRKCFITAAQFYCNY